MKSDKEAHRWDTPDVTFTEQILQNHRINRCIDVEYLYADPGGTE